MTIVLFYLPTCATVCPSQALAYVPVDEIRRSRREKPVNVFFFGKERVSTRVFMMTPTEVDAMNVDIADFIWEPEL